MKVADSSSGEYYYVEKEDPLIPCSSFIYRTFMILNNDMTQAKNANNIMEVSSLNYVGSDNHGYLFDKYG